MPPHAWVFILLQGIQQIMITGPHNTYSGQIPQKGQIDWLPAATQCSDAGQDRQDEESEKEVRKKLTIADCAGNSCRREFHCKV
jgi:hypothetical protein